MGNYSNGLVITTIFWWSWTYQWDM